MILFGLPVALVCGTLILALTVASVVWAYRDAEARGRSGLLVGVLVLVGGLVGLAVWLLIRPPLVDDAPFYNDRGGRVV